MAPLTAEQATIFDLSSRTKLRVMGADRLRYLNGQLSNDLRKASDDSAIHACVLSAKGKIDADVFIVADGESFVIDSDAELRETLAARLERYIIADDVQVEDITERFALFHALGRGVAEMYRGAKAVAADRFGCAGTDLWLKREEYARAAQELASKFIIADETTAEAIRIERGVPRWGHELSGEIIPTEANLESVAIDYAKGCYIGQEVISRIKMSGQTNKRLCGLLPLSNHQLRSGMRLFSISDGKDVGWITSVALSNSIGKQIALGFVKRGYQAAGSQLEAREANAATDGTAGSVEIAALPFV